MKANFKIYKLFELADIINEKISSDKITVKNYISTENMLSDRKGIEIINRLPNSSKFNNFKLGDTLFSNIRTYFRKVWFATFEGGVSQDVLVFRSKDSNILDPNYLYYLLSAKEFVDYTVLTAKGVKMPRGDKSAIMQYEFSLPTNIEYQRAICSYLSTIDNKILINTIINQTLESIAQAIFKSWFIDFDPVKAKIAVIKQGGSIEEAELAAMEIISGKDRVSLLTFKQQYPEQYIELTQIASSFPSALKDSELGEIPLGWMVSEIGKEITVIGGGTPSTQINEFWENGTVNWATPKDLSNTYSKVLINTERKITEAGLKKISSGLLPIDTVLMSSRAPVGYLALAKIPVAINQGYIGMKCEHTISAEYMLQWCDYYMDEIKQYASGTTFAEISKSTFKTISMLVPPKNLIENFNNTVKYIYLTIEHNLKEIETLSNIRDSLLPKLLSGEFSITEIGD